MILTESLKIKTTNKNIGYYNSIGFATIKSGDIIEVKPEQLPETSKLKIKVLCDICNTEKEVSMFSYRRNLINYGYYACSAKCAINKNIQTNLKKYGVTSFTKTKEYITKTHLAKKEKYGDENYINIEKQRETNIERYGQDSFMKTDEFKDIKSKILLEKYNTIFPLQNKVIKEKWIKTNLKKYNTKYPFQNETIKEKISFTKLNRYNDENYNNREKYKDTCTELYGFDNPMKNEIIKDKFYKIFYEKYGERHPMHVPDIVNKMIKSGLKINKFRDTDLYYQSTYEKDFLDKYYDIITIERGSAIRYFFEKKEHIYYPDFYIEELNLIVEIKSLNWYNVHKNKNDAKREQCISNGFNFMFIIDKNYEIFDKLIKYKIYQNDKVCYQYKIKKNIEKSENNIKNINLSVSNFTFKYIDSSDKIMCAKIKEFIEKYEWLGKLPNRPTHRFVALYNGEIGAAIIMSTPNSFSKILGDDTKDIEKLISRGANAYWTPKNISSALIMWSIKWMVNNTVFRLFSAYSDTEAKEIGIIYQACNFIYLGQDYGSDYLYFDLNKPNVGWTTGRNYRKLSFYKKICKAHNINWDNNWNSNYSILWDNIPSEISNMMSNTSKTIINNLIKRKSPKKHKYIYILGRNKGETKILYRKFIENNPKYTKLDYPKNNN